MVGSASSEGRALWIYIYYNYILIYRVFVCLFVRHVFTHILNSKSGISQQPKVRLKILERGKMRASKSDQFWQTFFLDGNFFKNMNFDFGGKCIFDFEIFQILIFFSKTSRIFQIFFLIEIFQVHFFLIFQKIFICAYLEYHEWVLEYWILAWEGGGLGSGCCNKSTNVENGYEGVVKIMFLEIFTQKYFLDGNFKKWNFDLGGWFFFSKFRFWVVVFFQHFRDFFPKLREFFRFSDVSKKKIKIF